MRSRSTWAAALVLVLLTAVGGASVAANAADTAQPKINAYTPGIYATSVAPSVNRH